MICPGCLHTNETKRTIIIIRPTRALDKQLYFCMACEFFAVFFFLSAYACAAFLSDEFFQGDKRPMRAHYLRIYRLRRLGQAFFGIYSRL